MNRRTIQSNNRLYTYSPDNPVPLGRRIWGVISVLLMDEITELQPSGTPFISTTYKGLDPRVAQESGLVGLVGIPVRVFPNLMNQDYTVDFTVGAEGYIPRKGKTSVPQNASFPDTFTPALLLELDLHRPAVAIRGRTVKVAGKSTQALPGATVQLTGFWPTIASTSGTPQPVNMLALRPPLYFDRSTLNSTINGWAITPVPGDDKMLLADAPAGSDSFRLSDALNILNTDLLIVDDGDPERTEYMLIVSGSITGAAAQGQPTTIRLTHSLAYTHRAGATVRRAILPSTAGFTKSFDRDALTGDSVVFLNNLTNVVAAEIVEVTDGSQPREFHHLRTYSVTSDGSGYFQLPPVSRVAQVRLEATHPGPVTSSPKLVSLQYGGADNRVDFVFR